MGKVLLACEESQITTIEMRLKGLEAYSCDIEEPSGGKPEWHIQGDVREVLYDDWDLIIAHPPCTYLANSGVQWLTGAKAIPVRLAQMEEGANFFKLFLDHECDKVAIENPIMHKYALEIIGRKHDQIVQPYMFGHPERKATCFWLKNLPKLIPTNDVKHIMLTLPKREQQRLHYLPPGRERAKLRSKTFPGIAKAMADQWGVLVL